jgi:copper transport protein
MYRPETSLAWIFTRWLNFIGLMLLAGAVSFRFFVVERARKHLDEFMIIDLDDAARRAAVFAAVAALVSNLLRLWLQSGSLHGPERMWQRDLLSAMIFHTGWGKAWLAQTVAAVGVLIAALVKSKDRLESWFSAAAFAVIAAATPAFAGHAAAVQQMAIVPVLDDAVHVISASAWLGTLALLLFAGLPIVIAGENGFARAALLVNIFSPLALVMAGTAVFTGAMNAFVHINAVSELWTTLYGRILAIKIMVVLITATFGAYNWKVVKPRLGTEGATAHIKRSGVGELAVAVIIIFITAVLVGTPTT